MLDLQQRNPKGVALLFSNIIDQVSEAQLKLDYAKETIRLFYVQASLERILGVRSSLEGKDAFRELAQYLAGQREENSDPLAPYLRFAPYEDHLTVQVAPEGVEWIAKNHAPNPFLGTVIRFFGENHHATREEISALFEATGEAFVCKRLDSAKAAQLGVDYVLYFPKGNPDKYYYCIHEEMEHTIYHRFLPEDFAGFLDVM